MTITPGHEWGRAAPPALAVHLVQSDAALASELESGRPGPFGVTTGDLFRAVGEPPPGRQPAQLVEVDALEVALDGAAARLAVAHVVARRGGPSGWWHGPLLAVCNVDSIGPWNVAPKAHPNDGRADVLEVAPAMPIRARRQAWRRLPQGHHVPHPQITTRSVRHAEWTFELPLTVWLDGRRVPGTCRALAVTVRPDAFELVI